MPRHVCAGALLGALALLGCGHPPAQRPNVLLITLDTTRADHLGSYGYALARTHNLDRLALEGVRATDDITAAPITLPSHTSIMTGLFPPAHGVRDNGTFALADQAVTLAERFHAAGYRTQAFVSAVVLDRRYGLAQGFDGYDDDLWAESDPPTFMIRDRPASRTAGRATAWLDQWARQPAPGRHPFFLWVHFFDPHQPYRPPPAYLQLARTPYDAEIAAADAGVGTLLADLDRHGVLDDTLVVATADHGESLGEHGEKTHAIFVYDATVHVPLLLRWPGHLPRHRVYTQPVRSVDLFPTLLAAAGLPAGHVQGASLLDALRGRHDGVARPQYSESLLSEVGFGMAPLFAMRGDGFAWIRAPRPELYDRGHDPHEQHNLYPQQRRPAVTLDRELDHVLRASTAWGLRGKSDVMDRETMQNLQALGYLAPPGERAAMGGIDPKDGIVYYNMVEDARHLAQRERWTQSEEVLRKLLAQVPHNVTARNILAFDLLRAGNDDEARQEYLRSLADDPGQARVYGVLAGIDLVDGELDSAQRNLERAIQLSPGFVEAIANMGLLAMLRGNQAEAERWYAKAMAVDPHFPRLRRRLGDLYYERGQFGPALAEYRRTLAAEPDDFDSLIQAGNCARRLHDDATAEAYFRHAESLRDDAWVATYNRACLAAVRGRSEEALALLARAIDRGLDNERLLRNDPDLASLRKSAEFAKISAKLAAYREG